MHIRTPVRIVLLVLATALVAASCTYDYWLDFGIGTPVFTSGQYTVSVPYWMQNSGSRQMDNAAIRIEVTINGNVETREAWTDSVSLVYGESYNDMLDFVFVNPVTSATAVVIGSRWDEAVISY